MAKYFNLSIIQSLNLPNLKAISDPTSVDTTSPRFVCSARFCDWGKTTFHLRLKVPKPNLLKYSWAPCLFACAVWQNYRALPLWAEFQRFELELEIKWQSNCSETWVWVASTRFEIVQAAINCVLHRWIFRYEVKGVEPNVSCFLVLVNVVNKCSAWSGKLGVGSFLSILSTFDIKFQCWIPTLRDQIPIHFIEPP